ncbi:MAG: sigma-70 family RNA polymerase sigma factor [Mariniblastus sp.]|nr:sigma-70 family RNA polymerase sigma factor [Mariniblastus sp.]
MLPPSDETRFIEALTRHQPALEAYCHANLANREDAREVLQATCVKLWQKSSDWDPDTEFLPWAFTVARFTLLSHYRDQKRDRLVFDEDVIQAMARDTKQAASAFDQRREALAKCLGKLDPLPKALLHDYYTASQSLKDIAKASGRKLSAVKMNLLRIRRQLSACIELEMRTNS